MTNILRVKVQWTGFNGGPGVNVLHLSEGTMVGTPSAQSVDGITTDLVNAYTGVKEQMGKGVTVVVPNTVEVIDVATGQLLDVVAGTGTEVGISPVTQTGMTPSSLVAVIQLHTDRFLNGRRVRGRVNFGPLGGPLDGAGTGIPGGLRGDLAAMFSGLISGVGPKLCVYSRPMRYETVPGGGNWVNRVGTWTDVTSTTCWSQLGILTSRRGT